MKTEVTAKELGYLQRRRAADVARADRDKGAGPKLASRPRKVGEDDGSDYMAWLHVDIPCIACVRLGNLRHVVDGQIAANRIEAAHQKLQLAERGFHRRAGRRGPHWTCVALCEGHHRTGPLCCDPAQSKFWAIVGFEPELLADFIESMNSAYRDGEPGAQVVQQFASLAGRP